MRTSLNPNGLMAKFYSSFYNTLELPNNLCTYFWKTIFALIMSPFVWPIFVLNRFSNKIDFTQRNEGDYGYQLSNRVSVTYGLVMNFILGIIGFLTTICIFGQTVGKNMAFYKYYVNGIATTLIIILSIFGYIKLMQSLPKKEKPVLTEEEEEELYWKNYSKKSEKQRIRQEKFERSFIYLTYQALKAFKEKVCPIIEWKE